MAVACGIVIALGVALLSVPVRELAVVGAGGLLMAAMALGGDGSAGLRRWLAGAARMSALPVYDVDVEVAVDRHDLDARPLGPALEAQVGACVADRQAGDLGEGHEGRQSWPDDA
jgi:hypothetical protein